MARAEAAGAAEAPRRGRIVVRKMEFPFDTAIPRWWFFGCALPTHFVNALHLIFPDGERFFIRSVRRHLEQLEDPELEERVKAFSGQEGRHGREHERFMEILREQGYDIDGFLDLYRKVAFTWIEQASPAWLRLSTTAALEHFTATLAEGALATGVLDNAHPALREMLLWHAAEEIEHKSVAFDVLRRADGRYAVRLAGLAMASMLLVGFWSLGFATLLAQERRRGVGLRAQAEGLRDLFAAAGPVGAFIPGAIFDYLRPGFHPDQRENDGLARKYLESIGRLAA